MFCLYVYLNPQYFDITSGGVVKSTLKDELINKVSIRATKKWAYTDPKKVSNMTSSFRLYSEVQGQMEVATDQIKTLRGEGEVVFDNLDEKREKLFNCSLLPFKTGKYKLKMEG